MIWVNKTISHICHALNLWPVHHALTSDLLQHCCHICKCSPEYCVNHRNSNHTTAFTPITGSQQALAIPKIAYSLAYFSQSVKYNKEQSVHSPGHCNPVAQMQLHITWHFFRNIYRSQAEHRMCP